MSNPKFTPGPWIAKHTGSVYAGPTLLGSVHGANTPAIDRTNAALITAAPDLYRACGLALSYLAGNRHLEVQLLEALHDALDKAEGRHE